MGVKKDGGGSQYIISFHLWGMMGWTGAIFFLLGHTLKKDYFITILPYIFYHNINTNRIKVKFMCWSNKSARMYQKIRGGKYLLLAL